VPLLQRYYVDPVGASAKCRKCFAFVNSSYHHAIMIP
jgi:hypothetical protein